MKNPLDAYTLQARLAPAIVAGAPAFAFAAIFLSFGSIGLPHLIAGVALIVLFGLFSDVARRRGRAIEPLLIGKMGGLPTTVMLRHRDSTYDERTKADFHNFMSAKLGDPAPSSEDEERHPQAADEFYSRGVAWLRENTRNAKKFHVLFGENVSYGFRRNLLGLKTPGFLLNATIVLVCLSITWARWPIDPSNGFDGKLIAVVVIALLHAGYLALFVTEEGVFEAARTYARQLLLSTQSPYLGKHSKTPPPPRKRATRSRAPAADRPK